MPVAMPSLEDVRADFSWKPNARIPVEPLVARAEFLKVQQTHGDVTPEAVIERASDPESPFHECFEWDDSIAGAAYRDEQARHLIRSFVIVTYKANGEALPPTRYFVKLMDTADDPSESEEVERATAPHVYLPVSVVMDSAELRRRYIRQAFSEAVRWRQRHADIQEFADVFEAIDRLAPVYGSNG